MKITLSIATVAAVLTFGSAAVEAESCASLYGQCGGKGLLVFLWNKSIRHSPVCK